MRKLRQLSSTTLGFIILSFGLSCVLPPALLAAPQVTLTNPVDQAAVSGKTWIDVSYSGDPGCPVTALQLFVDGKQVKEYRLTTPQQTGKQSFEWNFNFNAGETHVVSAAAVDAQGGKGNATVSVVVASASASGATAADKLPPVIKIFYPAHGASVNGILRVQADAQDNVGVTQVFFYVDGKVRAMIMNAPPYVYDMDTTKFADGEHILQAGAWDQADNQGKSTEVTIFVDNKSTTKLDPTVGAASAGHIAVPTSPAPSAASGSGSEAPVIAPPTSPRIAMPPTAAAAPALPSGTAVAGSGPQIARITPPAEHSPSQAVVPPAYEVRETAAQVAVAALNGAAPPIEAPAWTTRSGEPTRIASGTATVAKPASPGPVRVARTGAPGLELAGSQVASIPAPSAPVVAGAGPLAGAASLSYTIDGYQLVAAGPALTPANAEARITHPAGMPATVVASGARIAAAPAPVATTIRGEAASAASPSVMEMVLEPLRQAASAAGAAPRTSVPGTEARTAALPAPPAATPPTVSSAPLGQAAAAEIAGEAQGLAQPLYGDPQLTVSPARNARPADEIRVALAPSAPTMAASRVAPQTGAASASPACALQAAGTPKSLAAPGATRTTAPPATRVAMAPRSHPAAATTARTTSAPVALAGIRNVQIVFNGDKLNLLTAPTALQGISMTPLREIFEHTDGVLYWYQAEQRVRAVNDNVDITLQVGSVQAQVNHKSEVLPLAPYVKQGRTMVPLQFIADALNVTITYNPDSGQIVITSNDF
ncbi:MAG TPA: Ig-like domain-containing protein [Armatimonadota bacterium]|jgi:hypothetical protein